MRLAISHETVYRYDNPVKHSTQYLRLTPHSSHSQRIIDWELDLPVPAVKSMDAYGNILHVLTLDYPHQEIRIRAKGLVETSAANDTDHDSLAPMPFLRHTDLTLPDSALRIFAERFRRLPPSLASLHELAEAIHQRMPYQPGSTDVHMTAAQAFSNGSGVCQDHTHVFIACARQLGVPARYVSGYLYVPEQQMQHVASHAWAEAWIDGDWHSFDISNLTPANEHHLKLAIGMDYLDACPVRGVRRGGGGEEMQAAAWVWLDQQQQ